jgi:uncharacterized protein YkwD
MSIVALGFAALVLLTGCTPSVNAEMETYTGINAIRAAQGLPPLTPDAQLVKVARVRSAYMAANSNPANSYFTHFPADGCNYLCIMDNNGVPHAYAGENIAWNTWDWAQTADEAIQTWHKSPPHMENILNCHYQRFGTGVSKAADGKVFYTMIFEGNASC